MAYKEGRGVDQKLIREVASAFQTKYELVGALSYGNGHINDTFVAHYQPEEGHCKRYIFQRINTEVFKNPYQLMENIENVTNYMRQIIKREGGDVERETLTIIPTKDGKLVYQDSEGRYWRAYDFIEETVTLQQVNTPEDFYESALAFGSFQRKLANFDATKLYESIKDFHNTRVRFNTFLSAVQDNILNRAQYVKPEIQFAMERESESGVLVGMLERGELPLRVTHNDTKLNNVLLDEETHKGICVIDLDTVMPGLAGYDYGDSIRFGASTAAEDEKDLRKVTLSLELFDIYTKGFMETAGKALTQKEIEMLPFCAKMMTFECGIRFLTDYLQGDTYFKTHYPGQNIDRCRTQFKLVADMESKWEQMNAIVAKYNELYGK